MHDEPRRFAFVVHPLVARDFVRKFPIARKIPDRVLEWIGGQMSPLVASRITGVRSPTGARAEGWFIGLPMTSRLILRTEPEAVYRKLVACGRLAESLGARIMGLGAFTKVIGDRGVTVAERLRLPVTTGNSYTAAAAVESALLAAREMGMDPAGLRAVVIGATGSIGAVCSQILARHVGSLRLVARSLDLLNGLAGRIRDATGAIVDVTTDVHAAVRQADLLLAVSAATDVLIEPEDLHPGAVVCDVARPRNVSRMVYESRDDVLVFDGGVIEVPGEPDFGIDFGFPPGLSEACMAETMVLALDGRYEDYTLGRDLTCGQVDEISTLATKHGFRIAGFRRFERAITGEEIAAIRQAAKAKRTAVIRRG